MARRFIPKVNDLVVFNHRDDAGLFRVRSIDRFRVVVVDRQIEDMNPVDQVVDLSMCKAPTRAQLKQLDQD